MQLVDTHCHIHEALDSVHLSTETRARYQKAGMPKPGDIIARAVQADVTRMICVGTTLTDSRLAVNFVQTHPNCWASIGIHPHEAKEHLDLKTQQAFSEILTVPNLINQNLRPKKVVAIGECGLDFYYNHSPKKDQETVLRLQIELALAQNLPMIFHVRDAFEDFWRIFDSYDGVRGVIHSFTATPEVLDQVLARNLYVGLNGIMTFTKDHAQLAAAKAVPASRLVLETDAPFLTPHPHRGTMCEPKHTRDVAVFLALLRDENLEDLAKTTTNNAVTLFALT